MNRAALLFAALLCACSPQRTAETPGPAAEGAVLRLATEGANAPFNFYQGEQLTGFEVELGNALAQQMGMRAEWTAQPFESLLIGLEGQRYDLVIASHGVTEERAKAVDFTDPHYCTGGIIVTRSGGPGTAAELAGKTVAVQVGTTYLQAVQDLPGVGEVRSLPKDTDALQNLISGRADAWVSDRFVAAGAREAQPQARLETGDLLFQEKIAMAVAKGNDSLRERVNTALAELEENGTYARLSQQYFGEDIRCD
ncbi:polar amino acid transport system substrate-binding protein [Deinobacterium chartae]|uniref:Polar amino acid transport system substrate-binding protein n=1 Tax=Deinobacterium chartae TaxID=521158 RepID=A0A841I1D3_9DEIO|nr:ABC transporter substrate-binding protein [Deinobacterium chartae]MBB6098886.1 polar amino acid transport system substrate-binding protein [Deinobacterium chartae]